MEIYTLLDTILEIINKSKSVPFTTDKCVVERKQLKDIIEDPDYSELAQCTLANCYRFGLGTKINNSEAQYLLKDGINKGFPLAKYYYAQLFIEGDGVEKDTKYAYQLLLESAEEGCQESWRIDYTAASREDTKTSNGKTTERIDRSRTSSRTQSYKTGVIQHRY